MATIAYYGPTDQRASKVAVGIVHGEGEAPVELQRWFADEAGEDVRRDTRVEGEILRFLLGNGVKSVIMADRIIGCPHEEGIDYPDGQVCPQCPFWAHRDRWTGEVRQ